MRFINAADVLCAMRGRRVADEGFGERRVTKAATVERGRRAALPAIGLSTTRQA